MSYFANLLEKHLGSLFRFRFALVNGAQDMDFLSKFCILELLVTFSYLVHFMTVHTIFYFFFCRFPPEPEEFIPHLLLIKCQ